MFDYLNELVFVSTFKDNELKLIEASMKFKEVGKGSLFAFNGDMYVKLSMPVKILGRSYNSVQIGTGNLVHFNDEDGVLLRSR